MRAPLVVLLLIGACALSAAAGQAAAPPSVPGCGPAADFDRAHFPSRPVIDNKWLPMRPGSRLTLEGRANRGGGALPHTVTFTVTDLTKRIAGVRTRVVWGVEVNEGELAGTELAFFAQDDDGNVWNLGEYPEEFEDGVFAGAPSTWIAGVVGAEGGVHMPARPRVGQRWLQGFAPEVDFLDCARVFTIRHRICVPSGCHSPYLRTHERSPLDPEGGIQTKFHARGVGIVQVGAIGDPEGETLVLRDVATLGPEALALARREALRLDRRAYAISDVYGKTPPARPPPGTVLLPDTVESPPVPAPAPPAATAPAGGTFGQPDPAPRVRKYTHEVDHPLVPLTSVGRTVFKGREGHTRTRVLSRVLDRTRRVNGVRVAIVDVREFEDGELVEHTRDFYAQDRKGRVWYFGERVDDIENGKLVGHEGQWLAGKKGAKAGLFMPAEPTVGKRFAQERAPGVAEDRSRVVAVGLTVTTPAGRFEDCVKTRDFAPLDKTSESKFYCPGVGLVREKPADGRLDLVRYE